MITENSLRSIHILKDLPADELAQLADVLKERHVQKGAFIMYADDPGPSIMFIVNGEVKVTLLSNDGKEIVVALFEEGDFFGELALLTGEERSANVVATSDCLLYVLFADDFFRHLQKNSGLSLAILKELALRLRASTQKIGDLALYDVYQRVARTLNSIAKPMTAGGQQVKVIERRPTHHELASMVGTSREMVTRALKGLEEDGYIAVEGKRIEIRKILK